MPYADNGKTFMFICNIEWQPTWQLHNARGHVAIGLGATICKRAELLAYDIPALGATAHISTWPVIDKAANQSEIAKLYAELQSAQYDDITVNIFTDSMFGASAQEQLRQTRETASPTILCIGLFGDGSKLKGLTKRLKLASF